MKKNRTPQLVLLFVALALLLSACGGDGFLPSSWAGITPSEDGSRLYVSYNQGIYALNATNGITQLTFPAEPQRGTTYFAAPVITPDNQLLAGAYDNHLYSYNLANGAELWRFTEARSRFIASPLVLNDVIYAPNTDGNLYALSLNGTLLTTFETEKGLWAAPTTDGDAIYLAAMDGFVYSLGLGSLTVNWQTDTGAALVTAPVLSEDGLLYVGNFNSEVLALNLQTGVIEWRATLSDLVWGPPALADGMLYVGDLGGTLYAFEAGGSATPVWRVPLQGQLVGAPLVLEDTLYLTSSAGLFYAIDLQGVIRWVREVPESQLMGTPVALGDLIVVSEVETDNVLIAYDRNGTVQWQFSADN